MTAESRPRRESTIWIVVHGRCTFIGDNGRFKQAKRQIKKVTAVDRHNKLPIEKSVFYLSVLG